MANYCSILIFLVGIGHSMAQLETKFPPVLVIWGFPQYLKSSSPDDFSIDGNYSGRSLLPFAKEVTLGFVVREIGMIECRGVDHFTGGNYFEKLLGVGNDAGGDYLCKPTCGGECIPNQDIGIAPVSLYPFGCKCSADRCTSDGPIITHFGTGRFKIICARDARCTCDGMGHDHHVGYLCNWLNLNTHRTVSFLDRPLPNVHPTYSPIRWCSCCPQARLPAAVPF